MLAKQLLQLLLLSCIAAFLCPVHSFVNSPKIISKDGNLVFESGANRNISFRLNGSSRLVINDEYDVLDLLMPIGGHKKRPAGAGKDEWNGPEEFVDLRELSDQLTEFKSQAFGAHGLNTLLRQLQNRTRASRLLLRRLQTRLRTAENKVRRMNTKLDLDSCQSSPCENGGTCYNTYNGFRCQCRASFEGNKCERDVNECALFEGTDLGCQNGGQCVNQFGSFSCMCAPGWHGVHCSQRKTDCSGASAWELCGHGSCVPSNDALGYRCICEPGWRSNGLTPTCTEDVDECSAAAHTPCSTKCINLPGSFTCAPCAPGLTGNGVSCRDINECETNNGGCSRSPTVECINSYGSSHCGECPVGWTGDGRSCIRSSNNSPSTNPNAVGLTSCAQRASICHPSAICSELSNTVICSCPQGMVGTGYGEKGCVTGTNNNCNDIPCLNGGVCVDNGPANYTCVCLRGFHGPRCDPLPNPCTSQPCKNDGRCSPTPSDEGNGFVCQCQPGYRGRLCDARFSSCNAMLTGRSGRLRYPPIDGTYDHDAQCAWLIRTNETLVLNVTFHTFKLEDSTDCRFDWLQINDGRSAASQLIGRYCGSHLPHGGNIISSSHQLYIWFRSDNSNALEGFDLTWESIMPQCGGIIDFKTHGTLASPGSPGNYPHNRNCQWHLRAPLDKRIKLTFFTMQLEHHDTCNYDFVSITDAISNRELYKFCGRRNVEPILLSTHEALILFHSDEVDSDLGFQLHYSVEPRIPGCGGVFTSKEGTIRSPTFSSDIVDEVSCDYEIRMAISETIAIDFVTFQLSSDANMQIFDVIESNNGSTLNLWLQDRIWGGSDQLPSTMKSLYNQVRIKYNSGVDNIPPDDRFELRYRMDCSHNYDADSGTISSPGYPNSISSDLSCTYKIITSPNTVITLKRIDFQLTDSSLDASMEDTTDRVGECVAGTSLRITDGSNQAALGPYCGQTMPALEYVSKTNMLTIQLQTVLSTTGRGFRLDYTAVPVDSQQCGGVHTKEGQNIRLPLDEQGNYRNDMTCQWIILAPLGKAILLHWLSFNLEANMDCSYDYVEIYDDMVAGKPNDKSPLARFCDSTVPEDIMSQSHIITVKFVSDFSNTENGFELSYRFVNPNNCGGHFHGTTGVVHSPNYPLNYSNSLDCIWQLTSSPGTLMELQVELFELDTTPNCNGDWLEVRNGGSNSSALIGRFCGRRIPSRIPSFSHNLYLHFHTDDVKNARGFRLSWRVFANACGGQLFGNAGTITSPNYPSNYPHNAHCEWKIRAHPGSGLRLVIEDLEMEGTSDCSYDYLRIHYDHNWHMSDSMFNMLCIMPDEEHRILNLNSNEAVVVFQSDVNNAERGFRLSYSINCQQILNATQGVIESVNYAESMFEGPINCTWQIRPPPGNHIQVEISHFDQRAHRLPTDADGGVYIIDGKTVLPIVGLGSHNVSDGITIIHNTSSINFRLEYRINGCLYELRTPNGSLQSPQYPKMYPNNVECYWLIHAPQGQVIELTVHSMEIEQSANCTKDALVVSNEFHNPTAHDRHCGHDTNSLVITSAGPRMHIRFISDGSQNDRGFTATYRMVKSACGGKLTSKNGIIQSPGYPKPYPRSSNCEWIVEVSPHHRIHFDIDDIELESGYSCNWDYVAGFDLSADSEEASLDEDGDGSELFRLCTNEDSANAAMHFESKTNRALVRFATDDSVQYKGFRMHFRESCGQTVNIDETDYQYISLLDQVARNETCIWVLRATDPSKHIIFTPTHVQLHSQLSVTYPSEADCMPHGVQIYEGVEPIGTPRQQFCQSHPPALISHGAALTISVPMMLIADLEGTFMTMDTVCGSVYTALSGRFSSPYYPDSYPVNIECEWILMATLGNSLTLAIEEIDMELSYGCNNDYLEVREESERGALIGVYCGTELPTSIKSKGTIWMKFKSNDDIVGKGFMASYNYEKHNELNGTEGTVTSPNYPTKFQSSDRYSWRITVDKDYVIVLNVMRLRDVDHPYFHVYDGYTDIGSELTVSTHKPLISNTNVVFITSTRGPFTLNWERLSKEAIATNRSAELRERQCGPELMKLSNYIISFDSPGYPNGYASNLHCSWILMPKDPATHAMMQLTQLDLEQYSSDCLADYLVISSSSDLQHFTQLNRSCTLANDTRKPWYHGEPYLRVEFITDASVNKTGFASFVRTACGAELTAPSGLINTTQLITNAFTSPTECIWTIRVRQGKRIRITFPESELTTNERSNNADQCRNFIVVRNGFAEDSPFLGRGKYCTNNIQDVLETSSNRAYIKFQKTSYLRTRVSFRYEELGHACSGQITLEESTNQTYSQRTISSPNYPNMPNPYTECVWRISAPPQHRIAVEFIGNFDLTSSGSNNGTTECDREYVQLNDGSTELMPQLGRYCGSRKPDIIYSSGSVLRIKFYTDVMEPHAGFQAIVKLAACGGSYYSSAGIINSPKPSELQLHLQSNPIKECVYTIEVEKGNTISLTFDSMSLSNSLNCSSETHLMLEEIEAFGTDGGERISDNREVCGSNRRDFIVETNKIVIRLRMPSGKLGDEERFQLSYNASGDRCGETIIATQGMLLTPNYPDGAYRPTHCVWRIQVPKGRRVKVNILDFDNGGNGTRYSFHGRLAFANDYLMQSLIGRYTRDPPEEIISTDNTMGIDALLLGNSQHRGYKLRFTAFGESECGNRINRLDVSQNVLRLLHLNRTTQLVHCNYNLRPPPNMTLLLQVLHYNFSSVLMNTTLCSVISPLRLIQTDNSEPLMPQLLCHRSESESESIHTIRVPFAIDMTVTGNSRNGLKQLELVYALNDCGGIWPLEPGDNLTITEPKNLASANAIDCAWTIGPDQTADDPYLPQDVQLEVSVNVNLNGDCRQHYLLIYNGPNQNSPLVNRYCNLVTAINLVVERGLFIEYHMEQPANANHNSSFNVTVKYGSGCGGRLTYPYRLIEFNEQYKNNVECIWEIEAEPGFHIGLTFVGRFYIENSVGCVNDYLLVQQRSIDPIANGNWTELQTLCGRSSPNYINSTSSGMRLIFRSNADITGDGFNARFEQNCGGILYATSESQTLSSPSYPRGYGNNLYCNYTFMPLNENGPGVIVRFLDFELEPSPTNHCMFDNVTVTTRDKTGLPEDSMLCGKKETHSYRAQQSISVLLRTDNTFSGHGFELDYSTNLCGGLVNTSQVIESPRQHQDDKMPHNSDCYWNLTAAEGHKFTIKFELLDFETGNPQCSYDGVEIFASPVPDEKQRIARFCGQLNRDLPTLHISTNRALVRSYSDPTSPSVGFRALVRVIPNCDARIYLGENNASYTFNKFVGNYDNNLDCGYVFQAPAGYQIAVEFRSFHIQGTDNCTADYLEFHDGPAPFADEIGRFCGQDLPPNLMSSRQALFMRFATDSSTTDTGFELILTAKPLVCGNPLIKLENKQTFELHSPTNEQGNYDNNLNCLWKIESENFLHLQFLSLNMENATAKGQCTADYIKIYNSENAQLIEQGYGNEVIFNGKAENQFYSDFATEHTYCGTGLPNNYYPNSREVYIKFHTNDAVTGSGFRISAVRDSICQQSYGGTQGRIKLTDNVDCDIFISAPINTTISMYFAELMFSTSDCDSHVEIFEMATNKSLKRLCGYLPTGKSVFTDTNKLRVRLKTGSYMISFDMTYIATNRTLGQGCGGDLYNTEGIIANAFYSQNIRENSDCVFNIRVPSNTHVLLTFEVFDLGSKATCHTDFVEIQEIGETVAQRRFCGEDKPRVYLSQKSQLALRFHKSVNYDGIGWVVKFSGVYSNYQIPSYMLE